MLKAPDIYWTLYSIDIATKMKVSSLALTILRIIMIRVKDLFISLLTTKIHSFVVLTMVDIPMYTNHMVRNSTITMFIHGIHMSWE